MNKRIKKLAEMHGFVNEHMTPGEKSDALKKYEKFAQLIVRECADFIDSHKRVDEYGLACDIVYGVDLMKHFGVGK
jgi:hypothetical protein